MKELFNKGYLDECCVYMFPKDYLAKIEDIDIPKISNEYPQNEDRNNIKNNINNKGILNTSVENSMEEQEKLKTISNIELDFKFQCSNTD